MMQREKNVIFDVLREVAFQTQTNYQTYEYIKETRFKSGVYRVCVRNENNTIFMSKLVVEAANKSFFKILYLIYR